MSQMKEAVESGGDKAGRTEASIVFSLQITKHTTEKDVQKMLRTVEKALFIHRKKSGVSAEE